MKPNTKLADRLLFLALTVAALTSFNGCRSVPPEVEYRPLPQISTPENWFVSDHYRLLRPGRVVIVTPQNRTGNFQDQERLARSLATELRARGVAEAVIGSQRMTCPTNSIRQGKIDEYELVRLARTFNADAVLYCDVVDMSAYSPLHASVSISLVDARESVLLFAMDGTWDLRVAETSNEYSAFVGHGHKLEDNPAQVHLQSPTEFLRYVAWDIAGFMGTAQ